MSVLNDSLENCVDVGPYLNGLTHAHVWRFLSGIPTSTKAMNFIRCPGQFLLPGCGLSSAYTSKYSLSLGFEGIQLCFLNATEKPREK
jgi:hypothetical protein